MSLVVSPQLLNLVRQNVTRGGRGTRFLHFFKGTTTGAASQSRKLCSSMITHLEIKNASPRAPFCKSINSCWTNTFLRHFVGYSGAKLKRTSIFEDKKKEKNEFDEALAKGDKVMKLKLKSTRLDYVVKTGLQISRNKVEKTFYDDRVRLNGSRPKKKSQLLHEGDEVDIIRGQNEVNSQFLDISRLEIVQLGEEEDIDDEEFSDEESDTEGSARIPATLKRYKRLTIENYDEPWKGPVEK